MEVCAVELDLDIHFAMDESDISMESCKPVSSADASVVGMRDPESVERAGQASSVVASESLAVPRGILKISNNKKLLLPIHFYWFINYY